jgi:predicted MPP superfamily phosphohydrolase
MRISEIVVLIVFLLFIVSVYILEISQITVFALNKLQGGHRKNLFSPIKAIVLHFFAVIGIICFLYGYFIEPYRIEVKMIQIPTAKLNQTSFRVVQISDLHCDKKELNEKLMVELTNKLEPDVIVFTGDAVNYPSALPLFKGTMKSLNASLGKLAVYGNWETQHWRGLDYYSDTGFQHIDNDTVELLKNGETITVTGLSCDKPNAAKKIFQELPNDRFNVFLYHYSSLIESIDNYNIDLYLCGHTHGGQVALPFYGALITMSKFGKRYESGMYTVGNTILYVNRGIGMDAFPAPRVRFLARPEITVFDIIPEN